jgi:hypothetical protein
MEKLLNDHMLDVDVLDQPIQQKQKPVASKESVQEKECEIEYGNLQDYLEVFGDMEDIT